MDGRSAARWESLSLGNKRRWRAAFGGEDGAREAYIAGEKLSKKQRGHAYTPSSPAEALRRPWEYPRYVGRHTDELNELARQQHERQHGRGPRGPDVTGRERGTRGDYTWVVRDGRLNLADWEFSRVVRTRDEAQLLARQSGAPPGVVMIVDRGARWMWRYEIWFGYPEGRTLRQTRHRMAAPAVTAEQNRAKLVQWREEMNQPRRRKKRT